MTNEAIESGVDAIDRNACSSRNPARVRLVFSGADQPQDCFGMLLNGSIDNRAAAKPEPVTEEGDHPCRQSAPASQNL